MSLTICGARKLGTTQCCRELLIFKWPDTKPKECRPQLRFSGFCGTTLTKTSLSQILLHELGIVSESYDLSSSAVGGFMFPCPCIFLLFAYYRLLGQTVSAFSGCLLGKVLQACAVKFCYCQFFDYLQTALCHILLQKVAIASSPSNLASDNFTARYA